MHPSDSNGLSARLASGSPALWT